MSQAFNRYIGIDYSGAETPDSSLKRLRVYIAEGDGAEPREVPPPTGSRKYWSRRGVAHWLVEVLKEDIPTIVGIDHGFSFPLRYFETHQLKPDWYVFLDDFQLHWPTDQGNVYVDFARDGLVGNGPARQGNAKWRRLTEQYCRAKSVFHFDVQGSVAKSTHSGIPWLRYLRQQLGQTIHFWPFDGWDVPTGRSAVVEAYPSILRRRLDAHTEMTSDQLDAYSIADWLRRADRDERLHAELHPELSLAERTVAEVEGWIVGVP